MPVNRNPVNKVIIVGHHQEAIELVESALYSSGMQIGCPSRREGLFPKDFTRLLCDDHGIRSSDSPLKPEHIRQIEPAAMWNSILLDLTIGNSEHAMWGWSDSDAIVVIDYWLKNDPHASIVFVYSNPSSLIDYNVAEVGEGEFRLQLDSWAAYNTEMLRVFSKHRDRCVLASIHRLRAIPGACQEKLNMALDLSKAADVALLPQQYYQANELRIDHEEFDRLGCAAKQYLVAGYLRENSGYEHLYDQLQSAADLPDESDVSHQRDYKVIWESLVTSPQLLALGYCQMRTTLLDYQERYHFKSVQNEDLFLQLQQSTEEVVEHRLRIERIAGEVAAEERLATKKRVRQELRYRLGNTMISCSRSPRGWFRMIFALIGEIRRPNRKKARVTKRLSKGKNYKKRDKEKVAIKQQLSYRLGSKLVAHARSPIGWVTLPFVLIHETIAFKRKRRSKKAGSNKITSNKNGRKKRN